MTQSITYLLILLMVNGCTDGRDRYVKRNNNNNNKNISTIRKHSVTYNRRR
jgi:hypothetical protein